MSSPSGAFPFMVPTTTRRPLPWLSGPTPAAFDTPTTSCGSPGARPLCQYWCRPLDGGFFGRGDVSPGNHRVFGRCRTAAGTGIHDQLYYNLNAARRQRTVVGRFSVVGGFSVVGRFTADIPQARRPLANFGRHIVTGALASFSSSPSFTDSVAELSHPPLTATVARQLGLGKEIRVHGRTRSDGVRFMESSNVKCRDFDGHRLNLTNLPCLLPEAEHSTIALDFSQ